MADFRFAVLTPAMSATPDYVAGDCIGIPMLYNGTPTSRRGVKIQKVFITDAANQGPALTVLFFRAQPAGTFTDNAALPLSAADLALVCGMVSVVAGDWKTIDSKKLANLGGLQEIVGSNAGALYVVLMADGAYNGASAADLTVTIADEAPK